MRLIVVRHGETKENSKKILMGHRHGTLSRKGVRQARETALRLSHEKIDIIFSSDLRRAKLTAKEIARYHNAPIVYTKHLL
jgi:probable phosphoglycerate mutase